MNVLLFSLFVLLLPSARGATGITPPEGTGGTNMNTSTNGLLNIATNNVKISGVATQANFVGGKNIKLTGTNASDKVSLGVAVTDDVSLSGTLGVDGAATFNGVTFGGLTVFDDDATFNNAFILPSGAINGYVLTTDGTGVGAWAATAGIGGTNLLTTTNQQPVLVFVDGDSQSTTNYAGYGKAWSDYLKTKHPWTNFTFTNIAADFRTSSNNVLNYASRGGSRNILTNTVPHSAVYFGWFGYADIISGHSPSAVIANMSNSMVLARRSGYCVVVPTVQQGGGSAYYTNESPTLVMTNRWTYNNWLRTEARTNQLYDYLIDIETIFTNSIPQYNENYADVVLDQFSTNYDLAIPPGGDATHWNALAQSIVAAHIASNVTRWATQPLGIHGGTIRGPVGLTVDGPLILPQGSPSAGKVWIATNSAGLGFWGTAGAGSGTPGGSTFSVQYNGTNAFAGDTNFQYLPQHDVSGDPFPATVSLNFNAFTNALNGYGVGSLSYHNFGLFAGNAIKWLLTTNAHLWPNTSAVSDVGSTTALVRTNFMTGFFMPTDAKKNSSLRSVDAVGVGIWSPGAAGANGNGAGAAEATPGAIQFAETNVTLGYMMLDSTNTLLYVRAANELQVTNVSSTSNTVIGAGYVKTRLLEVSNLNVSSLVVTNGLPAPGSAGQVLFNSNNVITASPSYTVDEFGNFTAPSITTPFVSAQGQIAYTMPTITVVGANSNQTVWSTTTNTVNMLVSTNMTFTNFAAVASTRSVTYLAFMKVTNAAGNIGVNWGLGTGYGVRIFTNANNAIWPDLTNTMTYVASWTFRGTNGHLRLSLEE